MRSARNRKWADSGTNARYGGYSDPAGRRAEALLEATVRRRAGRSSRARASQPDIRRTVVLTGYVRG